MPTYIFASLRGPDIEASGPNPDAAFESIPESECWRLMDKYRNQWAVENCGFKCLVKGDYYQPVYKEVRDYNATEEMDAMGYYQNRG